MTAIYPVTFVMSVVLIRKWTLSHYDDDDDDDDGTDYRMSRRPFLNCCVTRHWVRSLSLTQH